MARGEVYGAIMTGPARRIVDVFDRAADTYDDVGVPWFQPIAQGLVEELHVQPGERVLDVGCGRGAALVPLARATGPSGSVLGIDLSPRMIQLTSADVRALPQVQLMVADADSPGLAPGSFDVIASSLVLFFLPDPAAAVQTWVDLLAPTGRIGVTTFGQQDERWRAVEAVFMPFLPPAMKDARTSGARGPFASDEGVEQLLRRAGLERLRTATRTVEAVFVDPEHWIAFSWSHGQRAMWEAVPEVERADVRRQIVRTLDPLRGADGRIRLTQQVRHTLGAGP